MSNKISAYFEGYAKILDSVSRQFARIEYMLSEHHILAARGPHSQERIKVIIKEFLMLLYSEQLIVSDPTACRVEISFNQPPYYDSVSIFIHLDTEHQRGYWPIEDFIAQELAAACSGERFKRECLTGANNFFEYLQSQDKKEPQETRAPSATEQALNRIRDKILNFQLT